VLLRSGAILHRWQLLDLRCWILHLNTKIYTRFHGFHEGDKKENQVEGDSQFRMGSLKKMEVPEGKKDSRTGLTLLAG
jgi:hypothetical protein